MTIASRSLLLKELRALVPLWVASVCAMGAARASGMLLIAGASLLVYVVAAATLGAMSIGHEYGSRTLGLLLSQPVARRRLIAAKAAALVLLLGGLAVAGRVFAFPDDVMLRVAEGSRRFIPYALLIPALLGLTLAPWITMLTRNPIAGTVFTVCAPGVLLLGGQWAGYALHGYDQAADGTAVAVLLSGTALLAAAASSGAWQTFMRLQVFEGHAREIDFPRPAIPWDETASVTVHNPFWMLIRKELRLQQLPIAVAAFYVATPFALIAAPERHHDARTILQVLTIFYAGITLVLIGAVASAEERQLGTLQSQLLLPMAAWKQWVVKIAVLIALGAVVTGVIPVFVGYLVTGSVEPTLSTVTDTRILLAAAFLIACSVYVSSFCSSGIRAFILSLPIVFGLLTAVNAFIWFVLRPYFGLRTYRMHAYDRVLLALVATAIAGVWFAFLNHRTTDRSLARVARQAGWLTAFFVAAATLFLFS